MYEWERARPTGQSVRGLLVDAIVRVLGTVIVVATIGALWNRHATFLVPGLFCGAEGCSTRPKAVPASELGAGIWAFGPDLPLYEHVARLLFALVTAQPVLVGLGLATLVTVVLYWKPELNRLPLRGSA